MVKIRFEPVNGSSCTVVDGVFRLLWTPGESKDINDSPKLIEYLLTNPNFKKVDESVFKAPTAPTKRNIEE